MSTASPLASAASTAANVEAWSGKDRGDENFPVGSFLIRKDLRPHVHAFYRFARTADDVSDHPTATPDEKLRLLGEMEQSLAGKPDEVVPYKILPPVVESVKEVVKSRLRLFNLLEVPA